MPHIDRSPASPPEAEGAPSRRRFLTLAGAAGATGAAGVLVALRGDEPGASAAASMASQVLEAVKPFVRS